MKKWFRKGTALCLAASLAAGAVISTSAASLRTKQEESLKIAVLSDTHYLSPDMIADTADFNEHLNSDRKMFAESDAFLTALLNTVKKDDPDVLLISGDLTKDGEKEGHEELAEKLEKLEQETGVQVYLTPGNHDLNNSNAMNFNTDSGEAEPAGRTSQADYKEIYADLVYNDEHVIATFTPAQGKQGGGLSYAARPKDGFTIISIDAARYSADNTDSGTDEHETSGNVSSDLEQWVVEQIAAAKKRNDTVIGLQHHGMVPHFSMEPDLLPMYLVNDYERLAQVYADAGMSYIFTGHMHANDIATVTTQAGNTLYDIETGSVVTYPSPARSVTLTRTIENGTVSEEMDVKTYTGVNAGTFVNPKTGEEQTVSDISAYGREHGFSNEMLTTTVNGFLHDYYAQIAQTGGLRPVLVNLVNGMLGETVQFKNFDQLITVGLPMLLPTEAEGGSFYYSSQGGIVIDTTGSSLELQILIPTAGLLETLNVLFDKLDAEIKDSTQLDQAVTTLIESLTQIAVASDGETPKTLLDYVNYIYQSHLGGEDSGEQPEWVKATAQKIENGDLVDQVIDLLVTNISDLLNQVLDNLSVTETLGVTGWDNNEDVKDFIAAKGRTPLLKPYNKHSNTQTTLALIFGPLGAGWPTSADDKKVYLVPAEEYSLGNFLDDFNDSFAGRLYSIDLHTILDELLNGTPADPEEGTPAEEGLITEEMRGQLSGWLLSLVNSMGTDSNHPQDNNTTITNQWKLSTNWTALDKAIAEAEGVDLTKYTQETAKAVTDALAAAKELPETAAQAEIDAAVKAINDAIGALKEQSDNGNTGSGDNGGNEDNKPETPGENEDNNTQPEAPGEDNTQTPENGNSDDPQEVPQTGDAFPGAALAVMAVSGLGCLFFLCQRRLQVK